MIVIIEHQLLKLNITCEPIICKKFTNVWSKLSVWFTTIFSTMLEIVVNTEIHSNKWENCRSNLKKSWKSNKFCWAQLT